MRETLGKEIYVYIEQYFQATLSSTPHLREKTIALKLLIK